MHNIKKAHRTGARKCLKICWPLKRPLGLGTVQKAFGNH